MEAQRIVVWFRQDLRLHDNEALHYAIERSDEIIPVYIFDERQFLGQTKFGFPKTGKFRAKFILEAVADLRASLQARGNDLLIRIGKPEEEIFKICKEHDVSWVYCNRERTQEEVEVQNALEENLWSIGREINYFRGKMLYYTQDLPFPVSHTPDIFTQFRKEVEKLVKIRPPFPTAEHIEACSDEMDYGHVPTLQNLGHEPFDVDQDGVLPFKGGETAGLQRVQEYIWEKDLLKVYKETRNGMLGGDYSSKLSPWLA
ncbi:MAG: deoxyribodipyrimidine photo-lyase, partial [Bacteroidota bacterium]